MTTEEVLQLSTPERAIFAIDLMNELFELEDCYSALNFSRFMNSVTEEVSTEFECQTCTDKLTLEQKRDRLTKLLSSLHFDAHS
jgi:hypothetical protein